jgi:hypothetical protein
MSSQTPLEIGLTNLIKDFEACADKLAGLQKKAAGAGGASTPAPPAPASGGGSSDGGGRDAAP